MSAYPLRPSKLRLKPHRGHTMCLKKLSLHAATFSGQSHQFEAGMQSIKGEPLHDSLSSRTNPRGRCFEALWTSRQSHLAGFGCSKATCGRGLYTYRSCCLAVIKTTNKHAAYTTTFCNTRSTYVTVQHGRDRCKGLVKQPSPRYTGTAVR